MTRSTTARRPLGFCVVGLGRHGHRYASHLASGAVEGAALRVVSRRSAEGRAEAEALGAAFDPDGAAAAARDDVDVVVVATPPAHHPRIARAAIAAGKHVVVEKPMAHEVGAARAVVERARAAGVHLVVAQTLRYDRLVRELAARAPGLGAPVSYSVGYHLPGRPTGWAARPPEDGGGVLLDLGVHLFDALRFVLGLELERVHCLTRGFDGRLGPRVDEAGEALFHAITTARTGDGRLLTGTVEASRMGPVRHGRIEIAGERGRLIGDPVARTLRELAAGVDRTHPIGPPEPAIPAMLDELVACIREGRPWSGPGGEDGLAALRTSWACIRSARSGGRTEAVSEEEEEEE